MVVVQGKIRSIDGEPYEGAIITATLNRQMPGEDAIYASESKQVFSDSYGNFKLSLVPTESGYYYTFVVQKDTIKTYRKTIDGSENPIMLTELDDYVSPDNGYLGGVSYTPAYEGLKVVMFDGDGESVLFRVNGEVKLVFLNGQLLNEGVDYFKNTSTTITLGFPMDFGDILSVQYKR